MIFAAVASFVSCNVKTSTSESYNKPELKSTMQTLLTDSTMNVDSVIFAAYEQRDFQPLWIDDKGFTEAFNVFFAELSAVETHGLAPQKMNLYKETLFMERIKQNADIQEDSLALFDYFTTVNFLNYCRTLSFGLLNPKNHRLTNYYFDVKTADADFEKYCLNQIDKDFEDFLKKLTPSSPAYIALQKTRQYYVTLQDSVLENIPLTPEKQPLKYGDTSAIIPLIAKRLLLTQEISQTDADSALHYQKFDSLLLKSVGIFQQKRGLFVDNEIGVNTIKALNVSFKDLIKTVDVNLERMRWQPSIAVNDKYIRVNVANQTLAAWHADSLALWMKTVVGEPPDHLTPFLHSNIYDIVLNPLWNVPKRIIVEEIALKAAEKANYITRNKMKVYRAGILVNHDSIDWTKISDKYSPYNVVQDAGNGNALGRIKFNFRNSFAVYLHDTNAKSAFGRHRRAISHGCVRVEQPYKLAWFCLPTASAEKTTLMKDKILFSTERTPITENGKKLAKDNPKALTITNVSIKPNIPVLLEYYTCYVNENNDVTFCNDVYNIDNELYEKLVISD
jgi:murein L,D-transpeptidase YcbB/YkuD